MSRRDARINIKRYGGSTRSPTQLCSFSSMSVRKTSGAATFGGPFKVIRNYCATRLLPRDVDNWWAGHQGSCSLSFSKPEVLFAGAHEKVGRVGDPVQSRLFPG